MTLRELYHRVVHGEDPNISSSPETEPTHSPFSYANYIGCRYGIAIDDFIAMGNVVFSYPKKKIPREEYIQRCVNENRLGLPDAKASDENDNGGNINKIFFTDGTS